MKMDVKATVIVEGSFRDGYKIYFAAYSERIKEFLKKENGTVIRRQLITQVIYGSDKPDMIMIIDFPNKRIAKTVFVKPEYVSIIPLRDKIFKTFKMYLADFGNI